MYREGGGNGRRQEVGGMDEELKNRLVSKVRRLRET